MSPAVTIPLNIVIGIPLYSLVLKFLCG
ncbi:MAG: hypothetical protein INF64_08770 [Roseomonas sp.]|nr:hypothetical protein [Roseomonas sp.]